MGQGNWAIESGERSCKGCMAPVGPYRRYCADCLKGNKRRAWRAKYAQAKVPRDCKTCGAAFIPNNGAKHCRLCR